MSHSTGRTRTDRHLPVTARYVEHISRLTEPGDTAAQRANEALPGRDPGAKVRRPAGKIGVMQVIGLDPHRDQTPEQRFQDRRVVIDAAQEDRLRQQWNTGAVQL